jgi:hypothetical protein
LTALFYGLLSRLRGWLLLGDLAQPVRPPCLDYLLDRVSIETWVPCSSNWHLGRKAARIDAEINERVNDGSADERGDDNYQHFQAEGTHIGSLPKRGYRSKAAIPRKHARAGERCGGAHESFPAQAARCLLPPDAQRPHHAPCVRSRMEPNPQRLPLMRDARCAIGAML